jgi:hypothetical protein
MTREDAMKRVLGTFATPSDGGQLANNMVFAQRLIAILVALDVVKLAAEPTTADGGSNADVSERGERE